MKVPVRGAVGEGGEDLEFWVSRSASTLDATDGKDAAIKNPGGTRTQAEQRRVSAEAG